MATHVKKTEHDERMTTLAAACKQAGLPLTAPRRAVFAYLASTTSHPTAQQIHAVLLPQHPTLSLATVYKNLETFAQLGVARKVILQEGVTRWDADMRPHHHAIHTETDEIHDIHEELDIPLPRGLKKAQLADVSVNFYIH